MAQLHSYWASRADHFSCVQLLAPACFSPSPAHNHQVHES
jgi:hypothetical protein